MSLTNPQLYNKLQVDLKNIILDNIKHSDAIISSYHVPSEMYHEYYRNNPNGIFTVNLLLDKPFIEQFTQIVRVSSNFDKSVCSSSTSVQATFEEVIRKEQMLPEAIIVSFDFPEVITIKIDIAILEEPEKQDDENLEMLKSPDITNLADSDYFIKSLRVYVSSIYAERKSPFTVLLSSSFITEAFGDIFYNINNYTYFTFKKGEDAINVIIVHELEQEVVLLPFSIE